MIRRSRARELTLRIGPVHRIKGCGGRVRSPGRWVEVELEEVTDNPVLCELAFCGKCWEEGRTEDCL